MSESPSKRPETASMEKAASVWALRVDRGLTAAEQDQFLDWMAADPRHGPLLARYCRDWNRLLLLARWRPEHNATPNPDLLAPAFGRRMRFFRPVVASLAAAATIAVLFFLNRGEKFIAPPAAAPMELHTAVSPERSTQVLPDGTRVDVNGDTKLDVRFSPGWRRVVIEHGEAHFSVVKNSDRPFVVSARGVDVRALGTVFNVKVGRSTVEVLVTEGSVRVDPKRDDEGTAIAGVRTLVAPTALIESLQASQHAVIALERPTDLPRVATLTAIEISRALAWQHRLLTFKAVPLREIIAEFNRRNVLQLEVADPELAALVITATFRSDNIDGLVTLLQAGFGAQPEQRGETLIVLRKSGSEVRAASTDTLIPVKK